MALYTSEVNLTNKNYLAEAKVRNHVSVMDMGVAKGGGDAGPTPMECLLTAVGGCVAMTLRIYAEHKGWDLGQINVVVALQEFESEKGVEKKLVEQISVEKEITEKQHKSLIRVAGKCPVAKLVKGETLVESVII